MLILKQVVDDIMAISNVETNAKLSNEIVQHLTDTQQRIYEINVNVKEYHYRNLELQAVLEGLHNWFTRQGFADIEIYHLMKDLDIEKDLYTN